MSENDALNTPEDQREEEPYTFADQLEAAASTCLSRLEGFVRGSADLTADQRKIARFILQLHHAHTQDAHGDHAQDEEEPDSEV